VWLDSELGRNSGCNRCPNLLIKIKMGERMI
jgi:hypothetical protein